MSMFIIALSCLTTSNLPWFMELTFQVPMLYCSLQNQTWLLSPVPSTTGCCFCFGSVSSFFLELFLYWSLVAYWASTDMGSSSFSVLSFCLFILLMGFSRQEYWSGLPFLSPVDHILSELSSMTHPSWVAPQGMAHSFIEWDKAVVCIIRLVSFLWLWFSVCLPSDAEASISLLSSIRGQTDWNPQSQETNQSDHMDHSLVSLNETMSHAVQGHSRQMGHGGEFWQNMVHWKREWQTTSVFLPWESHEQYKKTKR